MGQDPQASGAQSQHAAEVEALALVADEQNLSGGQEYAQALVQVAQSDISKALVVHAFSSLATAHHEQADCGCHIQLVIANKLGGLTIRSWPILKEWTPAWQCPSHLCVCAVQFA